MVMAIAHIDIEHMQLIIAGAERSRVIKQQTAGGNTAMTIGGKQRHRPDQQPDPIAAR